MTDIRTPLTSDTKLIIDGSTYRICELLSDKGGSCLAYNAEREPSDYEKTVGIPAVRAVIKEFNPVETDNIETKKARFIAAARE
ncbi:hypothetical protein FACS1894167_10610 [Synergistales bacterium]|nr:hypothetical protein FACS1894167_10610 [Synergistales bacterium]